MPNVHLIAAVAAAVLTASAPLAAEPAVTAFVDVTVVPMDAERTLPHHTVVVRDGRIAEVGPASSVKVPKGAVTIDGGGKWLMPGLAEMHGHLPGPQMAAHVEDVLFLFVAGGVTTVRGMFGFPEHLELRERVARGELLGPTLHVASPPLGGQSVTGPEIGAARVREHAAAGYDLLKVHEGLSRESFDAIAAAAREAKIPFGGHVSEAVGLRRSLEGGQLSIEHMDGYVEELEKGASPEELVRLTKQAGAWVTPTQALWQTFFGTATAEQLAASRPELRYVPPALREQWAGTRRQQLADPPPAEEAARLLKDRDRMLLALARGGAGIVLGSDAPQLYSVPGFSIRHELQAMIGAGLSPYEALRTGTSSVARYLGTPEAFGTVAPGRRADLLLLEANPLDDVANVARRAGVMVRGRFLPESEIQKRLGEIAARNGS